MKKLISIALALALTLCLSITAFADDITIVPDPDNNYDPKPSSAQTSVKFSVAPTYTVTIPSEVDLQKTGTDTVTYTQEADITAENVRLLNGSKIKVTLTSDFTLNAGETTLDYTVKVGDSTTAIGSGDTVAEFGTDTDKQSSTLHFAANDPEFAGDYSDTVTFNISVED